MRIANEAQAQKIIHAQNERIRELEEALSAERERSSTFCTLMMNGESARESMMLQLLLGPKATEAK